ncbi:hypothetical protein QFC21_007090 [Naganishia friedmannii]|uniref:Uncharacterized protein n=1 Tax=Naganishia friedmannii TaxID=89922 RepID=A0ACC2UZK2_9TREE|nr:hypothetical protein QFC21_007090 [Naganishia friedmannii]
MFGTAVLPLLLLVALAQAHPQQTPLLLTNNKKPALNLLTQDVIDEIDQLRKNWGIKGASVAVVRQDPVSGDWKEDVLGFGVADRHDNPTLFSIASNSKLFTAIASNLIVANETSTGNARLTSTTKIKDVVPDWKLMDRVASDGADLVDILCNGPSSDEPLTNSANETKNGMIARMAHLRPSTEFRRDWQYNNLMYVVASTLPEHLYGTPFTQYVEENIFSPLGMGDTTYDLGAATQTGHRADAFVRHGQNLSACIEEGKVPGGGYSAECLGETACNGWFVRAEDAEWNAGPGGVITSGKDMATWLKVLLLEGRSPTTNISVIPASAINACTKPYTAPPQPNPPNSDLLSPQTYGMGQSMYSYRGHNVIDHGGADPGMMSQIMRIPGDGLGVAVMVNDDAFGTMFTDAVRWRIVDHLLGLEPVNWRTRLQQAHSTALQGGLPPTRPENATMPEIPLADIPGTYFDKAYGTIVLCSLPGTLPEKDAAMYTSEECKDTLANNPFHSRHQSKETSLAVPTYIAKYEKFWANYLEFAHRNGSTFTVTMSAYYPETNLTMPALPDFPTFDVVFAEGGMAVFGNMWGAGAGVPSRTPGEGAGLKESAEVWFEKK